MRLRLAIAFCLLASAAHAQVNSGYSWTALGCAVFPSLASATTLVSIAASATLAGGGIPNPITVGGAKSVVLSIAGQTVNYRDDGTAPTATVGITLPLGNSVYSGSLSLMQLIQTASTATGTVCFYK
jgi:hypothetical protein